MTNYEHSFRRGLFSAERTYRLAADAIEWRTGRRHGKIAYADIQAILISSVRTIGVNDQLMDWRPRYVLRRRSGASLVIAPDHYVRIDQKEDRQYTFYPFVQELAGRIAQANPGLRVEVLSPRRPLDVVAGRAASLILSAVRLFRPIGMGQLAAWLMRLVGPRLPEHRVGRANLTAAFPDKPPAEIERILAGVWDNLGRVAVEFTHVDRLKIRDPNQPGPEDIVYKPEDYDRFHRLRLDGKPALLFTAHLANWELVAYVAGRYDLPLTVLYRRLENKAVNDAVLEIRAGATGTLVAAGPDAPVKLLRALQEGAHVGMLVDQHLHQGVDVTFFGRRCKVDPLIARLARNVECPIHGARVIRLADRRRFRVELTEAIEPALDVQRRIDIQGTMQRITDVVEGWVREHPDQWLWFHRRWR